MTREISAGQHHIQPLSVSNDLATEPTQWLIAQAQANGLRWLLAHSDDGVIWGEVRGDGLHLAGDAFPAISPALRVMTLQQARLFGPAAELLVWKDGSGWRARLIRDDTGENGEYYDETHLLWGDNEEQRKDGFVLVCQGKEGLRHAPPLPAENARLPAMIQVRHYLDYDQDDQAYVAYSRLIALVHEGGAE